MIDSRSPVARSSADAWHIRPLEDERDAFFLAREWNHYFGCEYDHVRNRLPWPLADVLGWIDDEDDEYTPLATHALVATHVGVANRGDAEDVADVDVHIGGGVAELLDHGDCVTALPAGRFDADTLASERNAWLCFGAVDPAWRGHGIGRALFDRRLTWAREHGAEMVFAFGWERDGENGRASSRPLFEDRGFVPVQRFDDYYATDGERNACPDCGIWPSVDRRCQCATTLWALDG